MSERARVRAVRTLAAVLPARGGGESLRLVLARERQGLNAAEQGLMADLAFGVCRHYRLLGRWLDDHLNKPIKPAAQAVRLALLAGLYELWCTDRKRHAVLNAWPDVCRRLKAPWAAGLCNALLRQASRTDADTVGAGFAPGERYSLPDWLWTRLQADWPEQAEALAAALLAEPPLAVRVNRLCASRNQVVMALEAEGFRGHPGELAPDCLYIEPARPVEQLPGFAAGWFSVQDEAAQLPVTLMEAPATGRILDACAAPGGKTAQLAERLPEARITALDSEAQRLAAVQDNLERLDLSATVIHGDATRPGDWWDGFAFDAILLDAPCTATGILRRQPDSKWHRREADVAELAGLQADMLVALWPLVKPGGLLVYATCSILKSENEQQIERFLAGHADAREDTPQSAEALPTRAGCQLPPSERAQDGFYFARLRKQEASARGEFGP